MKDRQEIIGDPALPSGAREPSQDVSALRASPPIALPPSLAVSPNIPWEEQTVEQLCAERDYWIARVSDAPGFASAKAADNFRKGCETWIKRRDAQAIEAGTAETGTGSVHESPVANGDAPKASS
jgi:hypothetical protein